MTIHTTANYHIAYCDSDTALTDLADATFQAATTVDAALGRGGIAPPDATSLAAETAQRQAADTALSGRVTVLETDTGWKNLGALASGYTANGTPQVRRIGKTVRALNGVQATGLTASTVYAGIWPAGSIPADCRPDRQQYQLCTTSSGNVNGLVVINTDGSIDLRTGSVMSSYFRLDGCTWFTA